MTQSEQAKARPPFRLGREYWGTVILIAVLALVCAIVQAFVPQITPTLQYDRVAVLNGEVWRMVTASFVHATYPHFAMNFIGTALTLIIFMDAASVRDWSLIMLTSAIAIGVGMLLFVPSIGSYIGFSAVAHGLYAGCAVLMLVRGRLWFGVFVLLCIFAEAAYEAFVGPIQIGSEMVGGQIASQAHNFGVLGGIATGALIAWWRVRTGRRAPATG